MGSPRRSLASPPAPNNLALGREDALPPVNGALGEELMPASSLAIVINTLDVGEEDVRVVSDGGVQTRERGFAPTLLERTRRLEEAAPPRKKALWLRVAVLVLCMISFSVMVSDKTDGWAGDSFHRYKEFRFLVAVNVMGFVYSAFQVYESIHRRLTMKFIIGRPMGYFFDLSMDQMARMITTMTQRDVMRNRYREAIQEIEYDSAHGVGWHIGRLDRLFWKLEMQEFPILDNYRIWALVCSLPENLSDVAHQIWGRYEGRITYTQLCTELLHYADCEEDPEEDPVEDSKESLSVGSLRVGSLQDSVSWHHIDSILVKDVPVQPKMTGHVWITAALWLVLVGAVIAYLVY